MTIEIEIESRYRALNKNRTDKQNSAGLPSAMTQSTQPMLENPIELAERNPRLNSDCKPKEKMHAAAPYGYHA